MSQPQTMNSAEKQTVSVTLLDEGGERYASLADLPAGSTVTFESSNPAVVGVTVREDGLSAVLSSDDIGSSTITVTALKPDGSHWTNSPDVTEVNVVHAAPGAINVTFSAPEPETPPVTP